MLNKGLVQIYTGDGKGKTTAALGLAFRAAGHGGKVLIYQFLKPGSLALGERMTLSKVGGITIKTPAERWDMRHSFHDSEVVSRVKAEISEVCRELATAAAEKFYDVIILDEIIFCLSKAHYKVCGIRSRV